MYNVYKQVKSIRISLHISKTFQIFSSNEITSITTLACYKFLSSPPNRQKTRVDSYHHR